MAEILLVNPRRRKTVKKRRTAAQKRATRKMIASNRRRKNPSKRRVTRSRRKVATTRRRRRTSVASPRRRSFRRRNPSLNVNSVKNQLMDAGTGAVGALGLDVIQGYLPIPENLKGGIVGTGVKALLAIGMGVIATKTKLVKSSTAAKMANGALIVVLHDELRKQVANFAPGIQLGEYIADDGLGYYGSGYPAGNMDESLGSYLPELSDDSLTMEQDGMGEYIGDEPEYIENLEYA